MSTPEASGEDRAEQDAAVEPEPAGDVQVPLEADPADAVEQSAVVPLDDDERR